MQRINSQMAPGGTAPPVPKPPTVSHRCRHGAVAGDLAVFGWLLLQPNQSPLLVYKYL